MFCLVTNKNNHKNIWQLFIKEAGSVPSDPLCSLIYQGKLFQTTFGLISAICPLHPRLSTQVVEQMGIFLGW
jgi:hypothetical protein